MMADDWRQVAMNQLERQPVRIHTTTAGIYLPVAVRIAEPLKLHAPRLRVFLELSNQALRRAQVVATYDAHANPFSLTM